MALKVRPIVTKPKRPSHVTIDDFIIMYLRQHRLGKAYVHEMLDAYNMKYRYGKKPAKYTSFRTVVWNLKDEEVIVPTTAPLGDEDRGGFPKSYYALTGKQHKKKIKRSI
jgi:hypothetical protein